LPCAEVDGSPPLPRVVVGVERCAHVIGIGHDVLEFAADRVLPDDSAR